MQLEPKTGPSRKKRPNANHSPNANASIYTIRPSQSTDYDDGIYNIRSRSRSHAPSVGRGDDSEMKISIEDEDPGLAKEGDFKQKQVMHS